MQLRARHFRLIALALTSVFLACGDSEPTGSGSPDDDYEEYPNNTPEVARIADVSGTGSVPHYTAVLSDGREFRLEDPEYTARLAERVPSSQLQAAGTTVALTRPSADRLVLADDQTDIRNQSPRNTCVVHAVLAGMEARYQREGHGALNLSEQYAQHVGKMSHLSDLTNFDSYDPAAPDVFENQLGMWGGSNIILALSKRGHYGVPLETTSPYIAVENFESTDQPGDDPRADWTQRDGSVTQREIDDYNLEQDEVTIQVPGAVTLTPFPQAALEAATHRVTGYQEASASEVRDPVWYEAQIAAEREVVFQMIMCTRTEDGMWKPRDRASGEGSCGAHAMLIVGYDRRDPDLPYFLVKNSWGGSGFLHLSYDFVDGDMDGRITEAAVITGVSDPTTTSDFHPQLALGRWYLEYGDQVGLLDVNRLSNYLDSDDLGGVRDRRLGAFFDPGGTTHRVNGSVGATGVINFYFDPGNPSLGYGELAGIHFAGTLSGSEPLRFSGSYDDAGQSGTFIATKTPLSFAVTSPSDGSSYALNAASVPFSADADYLGSSLDVTWQSDQDGVIGTGLSFERTDLSFGAHVITTTAVDVFGNTASDAVEVTITNDPPTVEILQPEANGPTRCVDEVISFEATVTDINTLPDRTLTGSAVEWRVAGEDSVFATGKSVERSFTAAGTYTVTVQATDEQGLSDEASVSVTVEDCPNAAPVVEITTPETDTGTDNPDYAYDGYDDTLGLWYKDVLLEGRATDAEDGTLSGGALVWVTDRTDVQDAALGTGGSLTVRLYSDVCTGSWHNVTLTATDSDGESRTDLRRIFIWTLC